MSELTVKEVIEKKFELEEALGKLLDQFSKDTTVKVDNLSFDVMETQQGGVAMYVVKVHITI